MGAVHRVWKRKRRRSKGGIFVHGPDTRVLTPLSFFLPPFKRTFFRAQDNCTFYINQYPPKAWWTFENAAGVPDNAVIEVMHGKATKDEIAGAANPTASYDSTDQPDMGWWYYNAPGSGVYFNVGKTIVADNKLGVLSALGMSFNDIATAIWNSGVDFFPCQASQGRYVPITTVYDYMTPSARAFTPAQLLEIGAFGTYANLPEGFDPDDLYMVRRAGTKRKREREKNASTAFVHSFYPRTPLASLLRPTAWPTILVWTLS